MLMRIAGLAIPLVAWEAASRLGLLHSVFTPPFTSALTRFLVLPAEAPADFAVTGAEILVALVLTGIGGVVVGVVLAQSERLDALLGGLMWFVYAAPVVVFTTLFVVILGIGVGNMISSAVFAEIVFARPGVGKLIFDSIATRNYPVVMGAVMITTGFYVLSTLIADLIAAGLDPRVRSAL